MPDAEMPVSVHVVVVPDVVVSVSAAVVEPPSAEMSVVTVERLELASVTVQVSVVVVVPSFVMVDGVKEQEEMDGVGSVVVMDVLYVVRCAAESSA